jgi:hypothetical protein
LLKNLSEPAPVDHLQVLQKLQNTEVGTCEHFEENHPMILPLEQYLTLEKRRKE